MKKVLIGSLVLFSVSFVGSQLFAEDNRAYYIGEGKLEENSECESSAFFGDPVKVLGQNKGRDLLVERIISDRCYRQTWRFLVSEQDIISETDLRNKYMFSHSVRTDDRMAYFIGERYYQIFTAISIIDKTLSGNLAFHILQRNIELKQCLVFSGYTQLRLVKERLGDAIVEVMNGSAGIVRVNEKEEVKLCTQGDYLLMSRIDIGFEETEPTEHIGQMAYYTGSELSYRNGNFPVIIGTELTIIGETADHVLAKIINSVNFLILRKDSTNLAFSVTDY